MNEVSCLENARQQKNHTLHDCLDKNKFEWTDECINVCHTTEN